jgi:hypothetical protein
MRKAKFLQAMALLFLLAPAAVAQDNTRSEPDRWAPIRTPSCVPPNRNTRFISSFINRFFIQFRSGASNIQTTLFVCLSF